MISKRLGGLWLCLTLLLAVALWICGVGRVTLYGLPTEVLDSLCQSKNLAEFSGHYSLSFLLGRLPGDPLLNVSLFQACSLVGSFLLLWLVFYSVWQNPVSATLASGLVFFGPHTQWLVAFTPEEHFTILLKAVALACLVSAKVPLLFGMVIALAYTDPAAGMSFFLTLAYLAYKRQDAYGPLVCTLSVIGAGTLLLASIGEVVLRPSVSGLGIWALWPLGALLFSKEIREARRGLYLTLLLASMVSGTPELASAVCLGDLAFIFLKKPEPPRVAQPNIWQFSLYRATAISALVLLVFAVLPGEQYLNRKILIHAQKHKVKLSQLYVPFSLQSHAALLPEESWRETLPFPGMRQSDLELLPKIMAPFRVLTEDRVAEDRRLSLVYALLCRRPLEGWEGSTQLTASSLVCKKLKTNVVVGRHFVLFRAGQESRLQAGPELPKRYEELAKIDFHALTNVPFRPQTVADSPGSAYLLKTLKATETLYFEDDAALVIFPTAPQVYTLASLKDPVKLRELSIEPANLELSLEEEDEVLPSRSLVPLTFKLYNRGQTPVSTQMIDSIILGFKGVESYGVFEQPAPSEFVLFPEEAIELTLYVSTPEVEGTFDLLATYRTPDDLRRPLPLVGQTSISTWRRLPPVGTWIEEPKQP